MYACKGAYSVYLCRIWVNPEPGQYDLAYTLSQAQRFAKKGYRIYLDFHFSDTWVGSKAKECFFTCRVGLLRSVYPGGPKQAIHTRSLAKQQPLRPRVNSTRLRQDHSHSI
jgi:hypothetical protein